MSLRLGDTAPDFSADTTAGPICTTELGYVAKLRPELAWPRR